MTRLLLLYVLAFSTTLGYCQTMSCNISTVIPTNVYYAGAVNSYTTFSPPAIHYLCPNAILYDTLSPGDRDVMINSGSVYYWTPCGAALSRILVKNGGILNLNQASCPTGMEIYIEPGAIINDPYGNISSTGVTFTCSVITFPSINCSAGLGDLDFQVSELSVFPVPTSGMINISLNEKFIGGYFEILDVLGNIVVTNFSVRKIDISSLTNGLYFLHAYTKSGENQYVRFIKQ